MTTKKVLIITYYWPPGGGAGVQRWLKFVKYLPSFGWQPVVYTPSNGEMPVIDDSLSKDIPEGLEVIRTEIWEPYHLYKKLVGAGRNEKINTGFLTEKKRPGFKEKLSVWLRGNLFIPDARCFWIRPSVKYLTEWLANNHVDAIVSTGPPHSMHLIAMELSQLFNLPWVADFRDPWTNIDYYKDLMLTAYADKKHHKLEAEVLSKATRVVVVGNQMKSEFETLAAGRVDVITNGFDTDDIPKNKPAASGRFVVAHVGTLVRSRNPETLWHALADLVNSHPDFKSSLEIRLTGKVDLSVKDTITRSGLDPFVTYVDYLPHNLVPEEQQRAAVLLLILNNTPNSKGILTGKLFEYLASGKPVLCIGPADGDAADIISETNSGVTCNFDDGVAIKNSLLKFYNDFQKGETTGRNSVIEKYSRKALTSQMAEILNKITAGSPD